ncbi:lysophospholipid acyltransferase family protein [Thiomicrorhabdus sp. ZW0627]|uniref:lysophospholipid acyltransferase family protein n=1 Tax=Thiomicrorhabdus sp. ZW0627 TaxID=3039774 RepID=UPI002436CFEC|nr:lysophospholipid acyltransferase family protein [Thiomicrorhabdus sp. ZW0627]MDG6774913.1 lysophospholipid acyltransferase family protein [Thiomicrorhabdus sp. ZW0627]
MNDKSQKQVSTQTRRKHIPDFKTQFLHPKYWGIWLGLGLLKLLSFTPFKWKLPVGKALGKLLYWIAPKRRRLAKANIQIAFSDRSEAEQNRILKEHFESLGINLMEMGMVWWGHHKKDHDHAFERSIVTYKGKENLVQAQEQGKGVLILAPHFTTLEVTGLFISFLTNYHAVYRPHDNELMDYLIAKGRSIEFNNGEHVEPVSNANTRKMLKVLKAGKSMTILPDQRYRAKGHIEVPFFGRSAQSNPSTSKIAKLTDCLVVPTFTRRLPDGHYEVEFLPALEDFPSGDDYADTLRLHHLYEEEIRQNPAQYLWVHNRWNLKDY